MEPTGPRRAKRPRTEEQLLFRKDDLVEAREHPDAPLAWATVVEDVPVGASTGTPTVWWRPRNAAADVAGRMPVPRATAPPLRPLARRGSLTVDFMLMPPRDTGREPPMPPRETGRELTPPRETGRELMPQLMPPRETGRDVPASVGIDAACGLAAAAPPRDDGRSISSIRFCRRGESPTESMLPIGVEARLASGVDAGPSTIRCARARSRFSAAFASLPSSSFLSAACMCHRPSSSSRFIPFGSVIDAIGASVRVTVACTAALAAELPVWGFRMRGDSEWMVRALRPEHCVILQEGDRAVLQADLSDADGRGMPSSERLMKATLIATPAMENTLLRAGTAEYSE